MKTTKGAWINYILNKEGKPVPEPNNLKIGEVRISTVFVGIDLSFPGEGPPLLWETRIFGGEHDGFQEKYSTRKAAIIGHIHAMELVKGGIKWQGGGKVKLKLRKCPWCKKPGQIKRSPYFVLAPSMLRYYNVGCPDFFRLVRKDTCPMSPGRRRLTYKQAITAWNRRGGSK